MVVFTYLKAHRLGLVCMAARRGKRWYAVADRRGGRVVGI